MAKAESVTVRVTKIVSVVTPKAKYTNHPFRYAIPVSGTSRQPVTGQENVINWTLERVPHPAGGEDLVWKSDKQNVVSLKPKDLSDLHMGKFPYIINPNDFIVVVHGRKYDNSYDAVIAKEETGDVEIDREYTNPKDHAELTALLAGTNSNIAKSKGEYKKGVHDFYIDDKEIEANEVIDTIDLKYEAAKFVREDIGSGRFKELIIFLSHQFGEYKENTLLLSDARIKALVLKACEEHPAEVLKMKGPGSARIIFVSEIIARKIIARKKNNDFYYGDEYIGPNFDSVCDWMQDKKNSAILSKWSKDLEYQKRREQGQPTVEAEKEKVNV